MEPIMPDLKSALQSALNEWNQPETATVQAQPKPNLPPFFTRTTDVTRETFNYVRDNPHRTTREIRDALVVQGHKESSVSALLSQMSEQTAQGPHHLHGAQPEGRQAQGRAHSQRGHYHAFSGARGTRSPRGQLD